MALFGWPFFIYFFVKESVGLWKGYLQLKYQSEVERVLLEIRIPREINKTPLAMELILNALQESSGGNWYTNITTGKKPPVFSLEIASHGGEVHFYVWCQRDWIPRIESHFYAQYPDIELVEVKDYAIHYPFSFETHKVFAFEYELISSDPIPIRTYKEYGQDRQVNTESIDQIDPIVQTIETFANINTGEELWMQIVCKTHSGSTTVKAAWKDRLKALLMIPFTGKLADSVENFWLFWNGQKTQDWKKDGIALINKIRDSYKQDKDDKKEYTTNEMTKSDKLKMDIIAQNITKPAYDIGLRMMYVATKEQFNPGARIHMMGSALRQYSSGDVYNGLKPGMVTSYDYKWQDRSGKHIRELQKNVYMAYKKRAFMYRPTEEFKYGKTMYKKFVLSTEELATIYHLPGQVARTPSFERIESVTGQAPANLPL